MIPNITNVPWRNGKKFNLAGLPLAVAARLKDLERILHILGGFVPTARKVARYRKGLGDAVTLRLEQLRAENRAADDGGQIHQFTDFVNGVRFSHVDEDEAMTGTVDIGAELTVSHREANRLAVELAIVVFRMAAEIDPALKTKLTTKDKAKSSDVRLARCFRCVRNVAVHQRPVRSRAMEFKAVVKCGSKDMFRFSQREAWYLRPNSTQLALQGLAPDEIKWFLRQCGRIPLCHLLDLAALELCKVATAP